MYCNKCGAEKTNSNNVCNNCSIEELRLKKKEHKNKNNKYLGWGIMILIFIVISIYSSFSEDQEEKEILNNTFDNVLYGTEKQSDVEAERMISVFMGALAQNNKEEFKFTREVESSNVMEYESFETKADIKSSITLLNLAINELENYKSKLETSKSKGLQAMKNDSEISQESIDDFLIGYNSSANKPEKIYITDRYYRLLKELYMSYKEIYLLLDNSFLKYEIGFDENGEENIFSDDDIFIDKYNDLLEKSNIASNRYLEAFNNYLKYSDNTLEGVGIETSTEDILNAYY